jgi:predicted N-formylglutamate amidohydrolase
MPVFVIVSCEHATNRVPKRYVQLFAKEPAILTTHRGFDPGAYALGAKIAKELHAPFFYGTATRLLIELNRSLTSRSLFSRYSEVLKRDEKEELIKELYLPYRSEIEKKIEAHLGEGNQVIHLSIHSFTPELNGEVRKCDIGLLYDPKRKSEKMFCQFLKEELQKEEFCIRFNYPYQGKADGFTTSLRQRFSGDNYAGIEIEVNQKYVTKTGCFSKNIEDLLVQGVKHACQRKFF